MNCATIPEGIAERLLFGARRGAFSGVTADVDGYVQAANGGTLSRQDYLLGTGFSLADITFMPYIPYLLAAGKGELLSAWPSTAAWWNRASARSSWQKLGKVVGQST